MELLGGHTLEHRLVVGPLPVRAGLRVCAEVASALAAAHAEGLVHRDIKPGNVMLSLTARRCSTSASRPSPVRRRSISRGGLLGTPAYLAPERLEAGEVLPACDVYALGLLLYRVLTGRSPWPAEARTGRSARTRTSSRTHCPRSTAYRPRCTGSTAGAWPATPPTDRRRPTLPASCSPPPAQPCPSRLPLPPNQRQPSPSRPAPSRPAPSRPVPPTSADRPAPNRAAPNRLAPGRPANRRGR